MPGILGARVLAVEPYRGRRIAPVRDEVTERLPERGMLRYPNWPVPSQRIASTPP